MIVVSDTTALAEHLTPIRDRAGTIAFVPTMGNLHDGHLALVHQARAVADAVVVSIFVNPMQFAAHEDLDTYPRTLDADLSALREANVDLVLTPSTDDIYPDTSARPGPAAPAASPRCPGPWPRSRPAGAKWNRYGRHWSWMGEKRRAGRR